MSTYRRVPYKHPVSQRFADLWESDNDLYAVIRYCDLWLAEQGKERPDRELVSALCTAALIWYCRCFGSHVREGIPRSMVDALPKELVDAHNFFKAARDKWIAHSINVFDHTMAQLVLRDESEGRGIVEVSIAGTRTDALNEEAARTLKEIASRLQKAIRAEQDIEKVRILQYVLEHENLDEIYHRKMYVIESGDDPLRVRQRYTVDTDKQR